MPRSQVMRYANHQELKLSLCHCHLDAWSHIMPRALCVCVWHVCMCVCVVTLKWHRTHQLILTLSSNTALSWNHIRSLCTVSFILSAHSNPKPNPNQPYYTLLYNHASIYYNTSVYHSNYTIDNCFNHVTQPCSHSSKDCIKSSLNSINTYCQTWCTSFLIPTCSMQHSRKKSPPDG